jgi:hypothetical protein
MVNRRKKFIGKKSQFGTVFWVTIINVVSFTLIIAFLGVFSAYNRSKIADEVSILKKTAVTEDNIISAFGVLARKTAADTMSIRYDQVRQDHQQSMMSIHNHIKELEDQTEIFFYLFVVIIAISVLTAGIYFFYVVFLANRIWGPIQVISGLLQEMIEGRDPHFRGLRKGDEFQDLYGKIVELGEKINKDMK